ncbi:uncharacterized protein LOC726210 isoform X2 [Apis mellifera]|uniref:Uncharacterized protein LOC726210 isoform X2 n=1 Tax=Apis mellifera TaxID=7460 RepID=A0A7M7IGI7_APIME|nr:uncharacterized protein LOC726210 isoform X2 [Apis mellifera]|eukprot:XP_016768463.1 uncharacterized protein LOC726210 isoform X2 [Apis mellifera]
MERLKRKRKRVDGQKKVLLSIVDPWDVSVASVDPVGLAERRGVSLSILVPQEEGNTGQEPSTPGRTVKIPSPWYKPAYNNAADRFPTTSGQIFETGPSSSTWVDPWHSSSRSSTWGSQLNEINRAKRKLNDNKSLSSTIHLLSVSHLGSYNPTDEKEKLLQTNCNSLVDGNVEEKRRASIKENETLGHGYFEDEELVNVVQDLVISRYSPVLSGARRSINRRTPCQRSYDESRKETAAADASNAVERNEDIFVTRGVTSADKITKITEEKKSVGGRAPERSATLYSTRIRKPSISMPTNLDEMEDLRIDRQKGTASKFTRSESDDSSSVTFSNSGSTPNGSPLGSETEEEANDEELAKVPLQAPPRKKSRQMSSMMSQKLGNDPMELSGGQSATSTITSVNSISSLLKEKLQLSIPQALRSSKKRQNADYRLRAFVGILFLCVVFLVGFAHIYYTQHVLQRAYFDKFRFNKNQRVMHVYSGTGVEVISARLGEGISADTGVFPCLSHYQREDSVCLEWLQQARLYLSHTKHPDMHCYHVTWQSLSSHYNPRDCFDWSAKRGHWYGGGQVQNMPYPLERGRLELSPFITGDIGKHPFGNVLKRYFLNSKGATILIDPETPLYVSIRANRTNHFCLEAKHDAFAYINYLTPYPQLNYTICAGDNMKNLHSSMAEKSLWDGLKPDELSAVHSLLTEPVWQISPTSEPAVYNYTEDVIALPFLRQGHVLLSEEWQPSAGDFALDEERFPSMEETINIIHRRGFRIVFTVQPFISTESINFKDAVSNRLLISERGSDPRIPALTRYKQSNSIGVLDITNNKTLPWLQSKLESLITKYHVDSFYLDLGTAQDMPHYYKCGQPLINPDHYKTMFTRSILGSVPVIGVSGAISRPRAPVFVSLPPFSSSWKAIKTVIPTILTYGILGYPFIMPGAVGGDVALPMSDNNPDNDFEVSLPDKELYVRWLQLSTFLPVIRFTHLPSKYSDDSVLEIAKRLTSLRQKTVTPLLKKYANETLDTGLPIIRPLWMLDPTDPACLVVYDEFSVGEELIVAPILHSGSRQREIYLPAGVWRDGIDGSLRKGSRWIHNYRVAEDKVAYFVKIPDNTRF